jgi:magnesium chelatase family protein
MYGKVVSACLLGIEGQIIEVEVDISSGLPQINLVGLPDTAIRESVERVRAAIKNCGYSFPMDRITVNLAPADLRKEGCSFDLAIAAGILVTSGQIILKELKHTLLLGELALDGSLRTIPGVLSMVHAAKQAGVKRFVVPIQNAAEARLIEGAAVYGITNLAELKVLNEESWMEQNLINVTNYSSHKQKNKKDMGFNEDYADVNGQHQVKRAMMIAAAGMHNLLLMGPPGTGKTMLIKRMPSILPPMSENEALEVTKIYSAAGKLLDKTKFMRVRPFRAPHHTVSAAGLVGGGSIPKPGEVSLAHRGVLFLDELPEFTRQVLEVLRQPLEDRHVNIGRARAVFTFPSQFILAAAMNPCPCGYLGAESSTHPCTCSPLKIQQYRAKISGPLLDRIDLHVEVPKPNYDSLKESRNSLSSAEMALKVMNAHHRQLKRYKGQGIMSNGELNGKLLRKTCLLSAESEELLKASFETMGLSPRAHDRILRLARTIADLEENETISSAHVAEAIQYRNLDKKKSPMEVF